MPLFESRMDPRCGYCARGEVLDEEKILCIKCGVVEESDRCRKFKYDPLKRTPPRPAPPLQSELSAEDFAL